MSSGADVDMASNSSPSGVTVMLPPTSCTGGPRAHEAALLLLRSQRTIMLLQVHATPSTGGGGTATTIWLEAVSMNVEPAAAGSSKKALWTSLDATLTRSGATVSTRPATSSAMPAVRCLPRSPQLAMALRAVRLAASSTYREVRCDATHVGMVASLSVV